jgi:hypothetical protein
MTTEEIMEDYEQSEIIDHIETLQAIRHFSES